MEQHPFKPYQAGHHFKGSCVQCGRPEADSSHNDKPDPMFDQSAPSMTLDSVDKEET